MNSNSSIRIVMAQVNLLVGDIEGNAEKVINCSLGARDEFNADAIVFPELTLTGYPPEDLLLRPGLHTRVLRSLENICRSVTGISVIIGYPHQTVEGTFNAAALIQEGVVTSICHKQHLPNYSVFDEKRYFASGSASCLARISGVPVGITICEDIWNPGPVKQVVDAGAGMIINLNASPFHINKGAEREETIRQRVIDCKVPVLYVNLVGGQDELVFDGASFVMDEKGNITCRAPAFKEGLFPVEFKYTDYGVRTVTTEIESVMSEEQSAYQALVLGVRDYIEKNGFRGAVIGLSGGIDSALTLAIAVDAIGAEQVEAVSMPSRYTADMSIEDARKEAEILGVEFHIIPIEPAFNVFLESLAEEFAGTKVDTTEENIQARCRGVTLMAISNKKRKIVLTTGNKSEMAVGYATLYGDMAGGFCVLKDVPKTLVYRLAKYRNSVSEVIPHRVIERPPSAELAPDQKDEDSLPPYDVLDVILEMYVEQDRCIQDMVAAGFEEDTVRKVVSMVDRNEYKRRQAPPGVRITRRAFGRDRRYPITSGFGKAR
jgi:NAD+ synthase (glutamine-hydrolysing)